MQKADHCDQTLVTVSLLCEVNCQFALDHKLHINPPKRALQVVVASGALIKSLGYVDATVSIGSTAKFNQVNSQLDGF